MFVMLSLTLAQNTGQVTRSAGHSLFSSTRQVVKGHTIHLSSAALHKSVRAAPTLPLGRIAMGVLGHARQTRNLSARDPRHVPLHVAPSGHHADEDNQQCSKMSLPHSTSTCTSLAPMHKWQGIPQWKGDPVDQLDT